MKTNFECFGIQNLFKYPFMLRMYLQAAQRAHHELASESTFTRSEGSWVVQGALSHTRGPLGSLEGPDQRLAIRGPLHALIRPFTDSQVRGPLGSSESPSHAPREPLPYAQRVPTTRPENHWVSQGPL